MEFSSWKPPPIRLLLHRSFKSQNSVIGIFSSRFSPIPYSLDNKPCQFFFEPLVLLDPKSIVSGSYESSKKSFIQMTIQMWNEDFCSKVLERLRSLKSLKNVEIEEEDVCVMPFEEVLLVPKSGSLPNSISLTDKPRSYLRSNEKLDFCLLCDSSSSAQALAQDLRQNTEITLNEWQLELECRGLSINSGTSPVGLKRPTFSFNISIESNDEIAKLPASLSAGCSSGAKSVVTIAPAVTVDRDRPASSRDTELTTESLLPTSIKQMETVTSATPPVKEEKVNVAQLKLVQQPSFSSKTNCQLNKSVEAGQLDVSAVKISRCPAGARLSWQPPQSTAGEITEYTVSLAVKGNSPTQCVDTLSYARVYCGPSPECKVPNSSLASAYIDRTTKPSIFFRIAAHNEKGFGTAALVMLAWAQGHQDPSTALTPAKGAVTHSTSVSKLFTQPPPSSAGCLPVQEIQTEPAPQERQIVPAPTPNQAMIQQPVTRSTSTPSSLNKNADSANSVSIIAATSATFTSPISSNGSVSVAAPVPLNIPHPKVNTSSTTIQARTMETPTTSKISTTTDLKTNTAVPVKRSSPLPSSSTASKRPKPVEHQPGEVVESPASSIASTSINDPTLPPSFKDTRSNQSVGNRTSLTITTPTASKKIAGAANLAIASETNSAGAVVAAVAPTTSNQSELSHFEATFYSVLFFFNGDERDDIFPEDVILVLGNGNFQTDEPLWDSIVMVHLDDGLIYPGIYQGKSVTQTTSSISSKITRITQFGVYPANFAASTLFYDDDSVASTEQLMIEAALALVSIALMEASEAAKLSGAPVYPAVSHKSKVIDGKGEGTRYSVDILMVDGSFSNDSVLPDYVANCYDHSGNICEHQIGCVMTVFKPNGCFNVGIFKGVQKVSTTNTAYSDGSAFTMPSPSNISQLEAEQVHSPAGTEAAGKVVDTANTSSTSSAATTVATGVSLRPKSSGSRPRSVVDKAGHSDSLEQSENMMASV